MELKFKHIVHTQKAFLPGGKFSGNDSAECETCAALGVMFDTDIVDIRLIGHLVDARHFAFADGVDWQVGWLFGCFQCPTVFSVYVFNDSFCQCDSGTARSISLWIWCVSVMLIL